MAIARKLPSGSWSCRGEYYDADHVRHRKRFTVQDPSPRGKKLCEQQCAEWMMSATKAHKHDMTVSEAVKSYLEAKSDVLSPSTIRSYISASSHIESIGHVKLRSLTLPEAQRWANKLSAGNLSAKTVHNVCGLFTASMRMFGVEISLTMPQIAEPQTVTPSTEQVRGLVEWLRDHDEVMLRAVCLAAFGTLRRGEVCAAMAEDLHGQMLHIHQTMINLPEGGTAIKDTPKRNSSNRSVYLPAFVVDLMPSEGRLVDISPNAISDRWRHYRSKSGMPERVRFHDLRHYAASVMHGLGIPEEYIMQQGGWGSSKVLNRVYRDALPEFQTQAYDKLGTYFNSEMGHELGHE